MKRFFVCIFLLVSLTNLSSNNLYDLRIMSTSDIALEDMKAWMRSQNAEDFFIDLADLYWKLSIVKGINPAVAYCQAAKETGFGQFSGLLDSSFRNSCGMKKKQTNGKEEREAHMRFDTWEDSINAHLDHLALYAGAPGYPKTDTKDPRHFDYIKGTAVTVKALGGRWAPSLSYGDEIIGMIERAKTFIANRY